MKHWLNSRNLLVTVALSIVLGTLLYASHVSKKIAEKERKYVALWVMAQQTIMNSADSSSLNLATKIATENSDIPIIETNELDEPSFNFINIDSSKVNADATFLQQKLKEFKSYAPPIVWQITNKPYTANKYYYGPSATLQEAKYYPMVQLVIVCLFIIVVIVAQNIQNQSSQNQVWAGMAKETAHQLGTPITSLQGWLEILKEQENNQPIVTEIYKDVNRLQLISERFGKIGSIPQLEPVDLIEHVQQMVDYIKKRAGSQVQFTLDCTSFQSLIIPLSPTLFDWVIENLCKNALDAMEGRGVLHIHIHSLQDKIAIDITDTGKGIKKADLPKLFKAGFTTKKRGWGLGLTLTKRIVEDYHKGRIFVLNSELGKGTTFRILLNPST
ncbi:MAG: sensor histidine kinase [Chitinophagaceae bacterium]